MTRQEWYLNLSILSGVWLSDFITKWLAVTFIKAPQFWGPFGLVLHFNPGAMLGAFADLPPVLRIVSLSTGGAFLFFIYLAIQYLIPVKAPQLRIGMSILIGGILGNVTDRIVRGEVADFLILTGMSKYSPAFNVADALQWVGYLMIVVALIRDGNLFWPEQNYRRSLWVNPSFQTRYIGMLIGMGAGFSLILGVFFYTYLKVTIDALVGSYPQAMEQRFLVPFFITFILIALGFIFTLLILGRILSHRMVGPLYAFEKFLEDLLSGKDRELKLRTGDDFRHLEELSQKLRVTFKSHIDSQSTPPSPPGRSDPL